MMREKGMVFTGKKERFLLFTWQSRREYPGFAPVPDGPPPNVRSPRAIKAKPPVVMARPTA